MQQQVTEPCDLLGADGTLVQPGYALRPLWRYDRSAIRAGWHRIKEWDYYAVLSQEAGHGITFTVADLGYLGLVAVCWLDFKQGTCSQLDTMQLLPRGRFALPASSERGTTAFRDPKLSLRFEVEPGRRTLTFEAPGFVHGDARGLRGELVLAQDPRADSMVIATSWAENRRAFYYNQKINCLPAEGEVVLGDTRHAFAPAHSFGVLDWGRGRWTYRNRWYWGSASGLHGGVPLGWNLGYGFSDRSVASENMVFFGGRAHKLDEVRFHFNPADYLEPWRFSSSDGRFEMRMDPIVDRHSAVNLGLLRSIQHQVFGRFSGALVLDDGTTLHVDELLGFAEDVVNWW